MNTHADKTQENKSKSVSAASPEMQSSHESTFQFVDNRPQAIVQRKLQEIINNSPRVKQAAQFQIRNQVISRKSYKNHTISGNLDTKPIQCSGYTHVVRAPLVKSPKTGRMTISEEAADFAPILLRVNEQGIQSANAAKRADATTTQSPSLRKSGHGDDVFLWADNPSGYKQGAEYLKGLGNAGRLIHVKWPHLKEPSWIPFSGNMRVDETNKGSAWRYGGTIPRAYIFIEGVDRRKDNGYSNWSKGHGWPDVEKQKAIAKQRINTWKQTEKDKQGGLTLIPGQNVRDIPVPNPHKRTGVIKEKNIHEK